MEIRRMSEIPKESAAGPLFTGDDVGRQQLAPESNDFNISVVHFGTGIKNKLHYHESDQILIVTGGVGVVGNAEGETKVEEGDVVFAPAGEQHYHGAAPDNSFAHITVTRKGAGAIQLEE